MLKRKLNNINWDSYLRQNKGLDQRFDELISIFFKPDIIDIRKFLGNYRLISQPEEFFYCPPVTEEPIKYTPTMSAFVNFFSRPLGSPNWFIAAYPDVVFWTSNNTERLESDKRILELHKAFDTTANKYLTDEILRLVINTTVRLLNFENAVTI